MSLCVYICLHLSISLAHLRCLVYVCMYMGCVGACVVQQGSEEAVQLPDGGGGEGGGGRDGNTVVQEETTRNRQVS